MHLAVHGYARPSLSRDAAAREGLTQSTSECADPATPLQPPKWDSAPKGMHYQGKNGETQEEKAEAVPGRGCLSLLL